MKQVLSEKKKKLCERIAGKEFQICYTSASLGHFQAECWIDEKNADLVNYKVHHAWPYIREGQKVDK